MDNIHDSDRLTRIETTLNLLSSRLLGNDGNGGELDSLHRRVGKLENWRWWVVGIAVGLGVAVGGAGKALMTVLGGK